MSGPIGFLKEEDIGKGFVPEPKVNPPDTNTPADVVQNMPNADKLTPLERGMYSVLPGFSQSTVGQALEKFGNSWAGKALSFLDIPAEGVERTVGLVSQLINQNPGEEINLRDAWYAGSLTADVMNLPTIKWQDGKPVGLQIPTDLPGLSGLAQIRQQIAQNVANGMSEHDALVKAKDDYTNSLGALALRSQLYDTYFHVVADPLNYLMPYLKPVERLQAARSFAMTSKFAGTAEDALKAAEEAGQLAKTEANVEKAANLATKAEKYAQIAEKLKQADALQLAGKVVEANKLRKETGAITSFDKFAIMMTGGDLFNPSAASKKIAKIPILNMFQLTPESKAQELMNLMADNYGAKIFAAIDKSDPQWADKLQQTIQRISKGATGSEFGHGFLTVEGRTAQAFSAGVAESTDPIFENFKAIQGERGLLETIANATDMSPTELLEKAQQDKNALFKLLAGKPELQPILQAANITPDSLETLAKTVKDLPYTDDLLTAHLMDAIETHAMRQAVTQFGVKARGIVTRWSNAMKSAETLAFMRLNPAYGIRNVVNNEMTMLARGVFGLMSEGEVDAFWKTANFIPKRLEEAFSAGSNIEKGATAVLQDAIKGGNYGAPEKIQQFFRDIQLNKVDIAAWSRSMEAKASKQAMTMGYRQFYQEFNKPEILNKIDRATLDQIPNEVQRALQHAEKSAMGRNEVFDQILNGNLNLSPDAVFENATAKIGKPIEQELGTEAAAYVRDNLQEAIQKGKVESFLTEAHARIDKHVDDLFQKHVADLEGQIENQARLGGPRVVHDTLDQVQMMWLNAEMEHAGRISPAVDAIRLGAGDKKTVDAMWRVLMSDDDKQFLRYENRMNAMYDGLDKAAKGLKDSAMTSVVKEARSSFSEARKAYKDFYAFRNKSYQELMDSGYTPAQYDKLQRELDKRYANVAQIERQVSDRANQAIANTIPDPGMRQAYLNYRSNIAQQVENLRTDAMSFRKELEIMPVGQRDAAWKEWWQIRQQHLEEIKHTNKLGAGLAQGDPKAAQELQQMALMNAETGSQTMNFKAFAEWADKKGIDAATQLKEWNKEGSPLVSEFVNGFGNRFSKTPTEPSEFPALNKEYEMLNKKLWSPDTPKEQLANIRQRMGTIDELLRPSGVKPAVGKLSPFGATAKEEMQAVLSGKKPFAAYGGNQFGMKPNKVPPGLVMQKVMIPGRDPVYIVVRDADKSKITEVVDQIKNIDKLPSGQINEAFGKLFGYSKEDIKFFQENASIIDVLLEKANELRKQQGLEPYLDINDLAMNVGDKKYQELYDIAKKDLSEQGIVEQIIPSTGAYTADYKSIVKDLMPMDLITEEANTGHVKPALDAILQSAKEQMDKTPSFLKDLPPTVQDKIRLAIEQTKDGFSESRLAATRFAEFRRDSALLNYKRRTNFDSTISNGFPFVFWTTGSLQQWAIESIDRPAMLTTYLRMKKFLETAGAPQSGFPSRFKDNIRVPIPFMPEWMGSQFIDPMRMLLPFDSFAQPIEQWQNSQYTLEGRAQRLLEDQLSNNKITQQQYNEALQNHSGPDWDWAVAQAQQNDDSLKFDAWDFASLMASPHAPIQWAYNAATGHPENIGPISPMSRIMRNAFTAMGITDWNNSQYNVEAKVRKSLGLPAYDKFDKYRIQREISNLITENKYSVVDIKRAEILADQEEKGQITHEQAMQNPIYAEAVKRSNQEYTGGPAGFAFSLLGLNIKSYPEGEQKLRGLTNEFGAAYEKYKNANDKLTTFIENHPNMTEEEGMAAFQKQYPNVAKDASALTDFFNAHPEYEARLGLFDKPEVRLQKFMIDQLWSSWNSLPTVTKKELQDQLGPTFTDAFLDKNTRSYDSLTSEQMSVWLKLMGGDPPGTLKADQEALLSLFQGQLKLTDPETAWRAQIFYDTRTKDYPNYYKEQNAYYDPTKKKGITAAEVADLKRYWSWRTDFMTKNPDLVPFLTDDQKAIDKAKKAKRNPALAVPQAQEIQVSPAMQSLINDYVVNDIELPPQATQMLDLLGEQYGMSGDQLLNILAGRMQGQ